MIEEGIRFPSRGEKAVETAVIGGILVFFAWLIVPGLALGGYALAVIRAVTAGETEPPPFADWWALIADGLRVAVLSVGYALVPAIAFLSGAVIMTSGVAVGGEGGLVALVVGGIIFLVSALLVFVVAFLYPASLLVLATEGSLVAAVSPRRLRRLTLREGYLVAWIVAGAVWIVGGAIAAALMAIVVGVFVQFYVGVAALYLLAQGLPNATEARGDDGDASDAEQGPAPG